MPSAMTETTTETCPLCGGALAADGELRQCSEHGGFHRYGERLLVRLEAPQPAPVLLPWETLGERER